MTALFESGRIVDLILLLIVLEAVVIGALGLTKRFRLPVRGLLLNLAAGAFLLLALRAVLSDAGWVMTGVWLSCALFAHIGDMSLRLRDKSHVAEAH